jgi:hypothetical protein
MALGEAQLVSSLYTPQRLGSIAQKLNDTNRLSAKNARKHTKTRENMRKTREKHAKSPGNQAKNTQSARQKLGKPPKNTRFLPLLQESHLKTRNTRQKQKCFHNKIVNIEFKFLNIDDIFKFMNTFFIFLLTSIKVMTLPPTRPSSDF